MPILKKQVQDKASRPEFLRDDEEVFHCQMTNEIFRDYEDFAERTILCNSMVWTCSMTGKSNLTYTEALQSEENARRMLQDFPYELRIPLLFLANKTKRNSFKDMAEDVWSYMKDRYFVGENIEACFSDNKWRDYHVLQVMAPAEDDKKRSPSKINGQTTDRQYHPHPSMYKYDLEQLDAEDEDISEKIMVDISQIRRKKGIYSKDKNKLFLKQYVEQGKGTHGFLVIKESALESFGIHKMKFEQIFDGPLPTFAESCRRNAAAALNGKKVKQETLAKFITKDGKQSTAKKNGELLEKMKQRELEFKRKKEELKQKATDNKEKKKLEESKIHGLIKDWYKPKEDLEVEDQRLLPIPTSVQCRIPEKYLGDALCILEFINTFKKALKSKDIFSGGLTLELIERALIDKEVAGPLPDIVQLLLGSIFRIREEEAAQYKSYRSTSGMKVIREEEIPDAMSMAFASRAATNAWYWSRRQQGYSLAQLSLYSLTVTEILRIHLLSSGATEGEDCTRWRYQMRGGYTAEDDPGLYFRIQYPHLLKSLAVQNIIELSCGDKLKLLHCLMNQLLTYTVIRDQVEDSRDSLRANKLKIRSLTFEKLKKSKKKHTSLKEKEGNDKKSAEMDSDEIEKQIEILQRDNLVNSITLGTDRAYRRYIKLETIPGFFVENEEDNAGICVASPTKQYPQLNGCKKAVLIKHLISMNEEMNTSDKENDPKSPKKIMNGFCGKMDITDNARLLNMCTANPSNCSVHCIKQTDSKTATHSRWTFYHIETQLDELIRGLNVRGIRETELKFVLAANESGMRSLISKTPISQLSALLASTLEKDATATANADTNETDEEQQHQNFRPVRSSRVKRSGASTIFDSVSSQPARKQRYDNVTLGYPEDASATEVMHLAITDNILEMEEKICGGNLGHLKLAKGFSREKWRDLLITRQWDHMDSTLVHAKELYIVLKESSSRPSTPTHPDNQPQVARKDDRYREYTDPGTFIGHNEDDDPNSSSNGDMIDELTEEHSEHSRAIRGLALALAQLGQSVGHKYLKKPLGHCDVSPKYCTTKDILPRWQQSLLASTSYSQLFLHYNTLDSCIMWSRSVLLAWCQICKRKHDSENMLLCDSCNNGYHLYCLRPKLTSVPKGDWFCNKCRRDRNSDEDLSPLEVIPRKKRRIFRDEDPSDEETDEEDEEDWIAADQSDDNEKENAQGEELDDDDEVDGNEGDLIVVEDDDASEGLNENEDGCEVEEILASDEEIVEGRSERVEEVDVDRLENDEDDNSAEDDEDTLMDECNHCKSGGEYLIQCDDCKLSYHLECVNPPLRRAPRGSWSCSECKERKECEDSDEQTTTRRSNRRDIDQRDDLPLHNASLQELLKDIMKHKDAWPFIRPVQKYEVPDYYEVIERPMDFGTIKYKLNMGEYNFDAEFMADSVLVFENCNTYNNSDADVYKCGVRLLKHFSKKCSDLGLKTPEEMQFDDEDNQPIVSKAKKRRAK